MGCSGLCIFICSILLAGLVVWHILYLAKNEEKAYPLHLINPDAANDGRSAERKLEVIYNDLVSRLNSSIGIQSYTEGILESLHNDTHEDYVGLYQRWFHAISKLGPNTLGEIISGDLRNAALRLPANVLLILPLKVLETIQPDDVEEIIEQNRRNVRLTLRLLQAVGTERWERGQILQMMTSPKLTALGGNVLKALAGSVSSLLGAPQNWSEVDCVYLQLAGIKLLPYLHAEVVSQIPPNHATKMLQEIAQNGLLGHLSRDSARMWFEKCLLPLAKWDQKRLTMYGRLLKVALVEELKELPMNLIIPKKATAKIISAIDYTNISLAQMHYWVKYLEEQTNVFGFNSTKLAVSDQFKKFALSRYVSAIPNSLIPGIELSAIRGYIDKLAKNPSYMAIITFKRQLLQNFPDVKDWTRDQLLALGPLVFTLSYEELDSITVPLDFDLLTACDSEHLNLPQRRLLVAKAWTQIAGPSHLLTSTALLAIPVSYYRGISAENLASPIADDMLPLIKQFKLDRTIFLPSQQAVLEQKMKFLTADSKSALGVDVTEDDEEVDQSSFIEKTWKKLSSWFHRSKRDPSPQSADLQHAEMLRQLLCETVKTLGAAEILDFLEVYNQLLSQHSLPFPLTLQRCFFEALMPAIEISSVNKDVIAGDITQLLPADFKVIGGKLLLRFKLQDLKGLQLESCVAAIAQIGSLQIVELIAAKNLKKIEGIAQLGVKCLNKTSGEMLDRWDLEILGNLVYFLPAVHVKNIYPNDFRQWLFNSALNSTKVVCCNKQNMDVWATLLTSSFGTLDKWNEQDLETIGALLFLNGENVLNIQQVHLQNQMDNILKNSPAAILVPEWPIGQKSFAETCKVLLGDDGAAYYQYVKTTLTTLMKISHNLKPVPEYTCNDLISAGDSLEMLLPTLLPQLSKSTLHNCLEILGTLDLPQQALNVIWKSGAAEVLTSDQILSPEEIIRLGNINLALEPIEIKTMYNLNGAGVLDALAVVGRLRWNQSQVLAISSKIPVDKLLARNIDVFPYFSSLKHILCGYTAPNITAVLQSTPELFMSSLPFTSDLKVCTDTVLSALVSFAINNTEYGDVTEWSETDTNMLGSLIAGLEKADLEMLPMESMNGLKSHVVSMLGKKLRFFSALQLAKISYPSAVVVDAKQETSFRDDQRAAVNYVRLGGARVPRSINTENWVPALLGIFNATTILIRNSDNIPEVSINGTVPDYEDVHIHVQTTEVTPTPFKSDTYLSFSFRVVLYTTTFAFIINCMLAEL